MSISLSVYLSAGMTAIPSVFLYARSTACLFYNLSVCPTAYLHMSYCLSAYPTAYVCLADYLYVCLAACLPNSCLYVNLRVCPVYL